MKYGVVQFALPPVMRAAMLEMTGRVPDDAVASVESLPVWCPTGRETDPHCTVRYGIPPGADPEAIARALTQVSPITFRLGALTSFPAKPDAPYEVLVASVWGTDSLYNARQALTAAFAVVETQNEFIPHATLAYLKPGRAIEFVGNRGVEGLQGVVDELIYSDGEGSRSTIKLAATAGFSARGADSETFTAQLGDIRGEPGVRFFAQLDAVTGVSYGPGKVPNTIRGKPIHIYAAGRNQCIDGRIVDLNDKNGTKLAANINSIPEDRAITYDHETDVARGSEAAGWMRDFAWINGSGLWAMDVDWTADAHAEILAGKWRFFSGDGPCKVSKMPNGQEVYVPYQLWAASLVPKPALLGNVEAIKLASIASLQAPAKEAVHTPSSGPSRGKEIHVDEETRRATCAAFGLKEDATDAELKAAAHAFKAKPKEDAAAADEAKGKFSAEEAASGLEAIATRVLGRFKSEAKAEAEAAATKTIEATFAAAAAQRTAEEASARVDAALAEAEKDGRIEAAEVEDWKPLLSANFAAASKRLAVLPKKTPVGTPGRDPYAERQSSGERKPLNADLKKFQFAAGNAETAFEGTDYAGLRDYINNLPIHDHEMDHKHSCECKGAFMSRAAAFAASRNIGVEDAIPMVALGEDAGFQRERHRVLKEGQQFGIRMRTGAIRKEVDLDLLKGIAQHMRKSPIPYNLISREMQDEAREATFASIAQMQAPGKYALGGGFGVEFVQGVPIGSELLPEIEGGADEKAYYLKFKTEKFEKLKKIPTALNQTDHQQRTFNMEMPEVTLDVYDHQQWADRRLQKIAATLPLGLLAHITQEAVDAERLRKESIQADAILASASYASGFDLDYSGSGNDQFSDPNSNPYGVITSLMAKVRKALLGTRVDTAGCGEDVFTALCGHPKLVQWAGGYLGTKGDPAVPLPAEAIMAILGISKWVVGTMFGTDTPGGADATEIWGQNLVVAATGRGRLRAPRFGATIVSTGYPWIEPLEEKTRGAKGSDGVQIADAYKVTIMDTSAAFIIRSAVAPLGVSA